MPSLIKSLFANDITRSIEEVIKVDQKDEEIIRLEIDEYVMTDAIARHYADGDTSNLGAVVNLQDEIAKLTAQDIQDAAQTYLNPKNYVKVTLVPEGK